MIIETIFSTLDPEGNPNFAPMGVVWSDEEMIVRPFRNTHTYRYLTDTGYGVANVTDDVFLFVQSALTNVHLPCLPACHIPGMVLRAACYWRELAVIEETDRTEERAEIRCRVVGKGWQRDFLGFNRGRNAVIEATIVATRLHLYPIRQLWAELERSQEIVRKTGGDREQQAMKYLLDWVRRQLYDSAGQNPGTAAPGYAGSERGPGPSLREHWGGHPAAQRGTGGHSCRRMEG